MTVYLFCLLLMVLPVSAAVLASSYVNILTQPGQLLAFWARFLYRLRDRYEFGGSGCEVNEKRRKRADYLLKPILTCVYCVGGQIGLWGSLYVQYRYTGRIDPVLTLVVCGMSVWLGGAFQAIQQKYFPL